MKSNKIKYSLLIIAIALSASQLKAQEKSAAPFSSSGMFFISGQPSVPLSGGKDWIDVGTWGGISFEGFGFVTPNIGIGGEISNSVSNKKFNEATYNFNGSKFEGAVTGSQYRASRMLPVLLKGYYYFNTEGSLKPFLSLGMGMAYSEYYVTAGMYELRENEWGFSANGTFGADYIFPESNVGIHTALKYNYSNIPSNLNPSNNISWLAFNLGVTFVLD
jgi:outer membrane protein W